MRLRARTVTALIAAAVLPLVAAGWSAVRMSDEALRSRALAHQTSVLQLIADEVDDQLRQHLRAVQQAAGAVRFGALTPEARLGALRLTFRQFEDATVVALLGPGGEQAAPPVYLGERSVDDALAGRAVVSPADLASFANGIPFSAAIAVGAAIGPPSVAADGGPRLPLAARTPDGFVLAVEASLDGLAALLVRQKATPGARIFVTDNSGRVIAARDPKATALRADRSAWALVSETLAGRGAAGAYEEPSGPVLGVGALLSNFGWTVVLSVPVDEALAPSIALRRRLLALLLVVLAVAAGFGAVAGRALARPIELLHEGATRVGAGELSHRVAGADRADELGSLARGFNDMAAEIERWNQELELRVDSKTAELRRAQELLLRAQKLAAVGQLGAGVAHEINNPLAGILGMTQLLLSRAEQGSKSETMLKAVETESLRIREIVQSLSRLAAGEEGVMLRATAVAPCVEAALRLIERQMEDQGIQIVREFSDVPEIEADGSRLTEAFMQLLTNARRAMATGGVLTLSSRSLDDHLVEVAVQDTGEGIAPELVERVFEPFFTLKEDWQAKGMGLTIVNRIVESHHGSIRVDSTVGEGTTFIVTLPVAKRRTLL